MEEKIEKTANKSLNEFVGQETPAPAPAPEQPTPAPAPEQPAPQPGPAPAPQPGPQPTQPGPAPAQQPQPAPVGSEAPAPAQPQQPAGTVQQPQMIDPSEIKIGKAFDGDTGKQKLDEDDVEEVQWGDQKLRVSKNEYTIEKVSIQKDLFLKKASARDVKISRSGTKQYIETRLVITYKDSEYISSLPKIMWFEDKYTPNQWSPTFRKITTDKEYTSQFTNVVSKLYYKYCQQFKVEKLGIEEFFEKLVGKKVQLVEYVGEFDGKTFRRLDIHQFK